MKQVLNIRPVSDLRNKYPEVESDVLKNGEPVFLTKNGYGSMVLLSIEMYSALLENIEEKLLQADDASEATDTRFSAEEVFSRVRKRVNG